MCSTTTPPPTPTQIARPDRRLLLTGALAAVGAVLTGCTREGEAGAVEGATAHTDAGERPTPDSALARLREGNGRFSLGEATHPHQSTHTRTGVAGHQQPWALVHGCVDSRVAPELVFDQGLGDLFVTRTAGTVLDDTVVGSMEFAVGQPYATPLLVILGHTGCGAVTATVEAVAAHPHAPVAPGEVADIVDAIAPVVRRVPRAGSPAEEYVDAVVRANVRAVADRLVERSRIIREAVRAGRTRVVPAVYDLRTGEVDWLSR